MSSKTLHPARVYWYSLLGYNGSSNWTDVSLLGHHARILDSRPCFHYSIRFEQVGLSETTRSCRQTDWMGNELILLSNERKILTNKTIIEMLELINKENFVTIHRSCVVNTDYVKNMHNTILTLKNGHQLATSRRKYKDIKCQILNLWGEQL